VLRDVTLPALERGLERAGRSRADIEVNVGVFVALDDTMWEANRRRIAFYGSTPGYRHVLDHHGLGELFEALHARSRTGGWAEMPALVDDDVLGRFVARGDDPAALASEVRARVGGLAERVSLVAEGASPEALGPVAEALR
jgi:alkanesulfonate monooxygenase SsuD/methylene tetrahydromethanopterin reductase-like flavin-dependent oxidoreductase (luciferase family)